MLFWITLTTEHAWVRSMTLPTSYRWKRTWGGVSNGALTTTVRDLSTTQKGRHTLSWNSSLGFRCARLRRAVVGFPFSDFAQGYVGHVGFRFQPIRQDLSSVGPRFISASCGHHPIDYL